MICQCSQPGYCQSLGRVMPEARWRECREQPAYCEMFHAEAAAGKYKAERYQRPYNSQADVPAQTPIQLSAAQKARNFSRAVHDIVSGKRTTTEERTAREAVCESCEFMQSNRCQLCGCQLRWKRKLAKQTCPVLKWDGDAARFKWSETVTTFAVGVTTCPRKEPTLEDSLQSIRAAGFNPTVIEDKSRDGAWNTFRRGLAQIIASNPDADCYLMFQDDVKVAAGLADYLPSILWPSESTGVVSLYCCGMYRFKSNGLHERNGTTWGALALCFTPLSARLLLRDTEPRRKGEAVVDGKVSRWCADAELGYWIHWPSLIQHTGNTSTVSSQRMGSHRRAKKFCGDVELL